MDDIVKQAMAKWPNVPVVYGWLGLDRRGGWRIKGDAVTSPLIAGFIGRNYDHDAQGRWFFQNGPQRVFVALEYTPFVYRTGWNADVQAPLRLQAHTGTMVHRLDAAALDENGVLLLATDCGVGIVDDRDLEQMIPHFTDGAGRALDEDGFAARMQKLQHGEHDELCLRYGGGLIPLRAIATADVAAKFGFVPEPLPQEGEDACT